MTMSIQRPLFRPRFTPIPPDVDVPSLVHNTPNFRWCHREDSRLHFSPFQKLSRIINSVTIEQGLPIVVDNWHLRRDWDAALFSKEWLDREHGNDSTFHFEQADKRYNSEGSCQGTGYIYVYFVLFIPSPFPCGPGFLIEEYRDERETAPKTLCKGFGLSPGMASLASRAAAEANKLPG